MIYKITQIFSVFLLIVSCRNDKVVNSEKKENKFKEKITEIGFSINDTVESDKELKFYVKFIDPTLNPKVKNNYFSHLFISDKDSLTYDNLLIPKETDYEIELDTTNFWSVKHTFKQKGDFIIKGAVYVSTIEFQEFEPYNPDTIKIIRDSLIYPIKKKVYVK